MYFFKSHESGGSAATLAALPSLLLDNLTGEEKPGRMLLELSLLVLLLHVWFLVYWQSPVEAVTPALPLVMQVSLIAASAPKSPVAASAPAVKPSPAPKKPKQKRLISKKPPLVRKPVVTRQPEPVSEPSPAKSWIDVPSPATATSPAAPAVKTPAPNTEPFTEANYRANYGFNPKPDYPRIARNRRWQGKILLRVQVSALGASEQIAIHRGSGHEILDESAVEAVRKWRFIPARRGDTPVASSVIVPILFTLHD